MDDMQLHQPNVEGLVPGSTERDKHKLVDDQLIIAELLH